MTYLVKTAGAKGGGWEGIPEAECSASGQDMEVVAYCLQKQAWVMNRDKRPRPQLPFTTTPFPIPIQLKLSISQLPHLLS